MAGNSFSVLWALLTEYVNSDAGKWLPVSPFQRWIAGWDGFDVIRHYLGYLNYFVPISTIIDIMAGWLIAIGIFYMVMAILRYIRIVGD